jgi:hypothetical protein
MQNKDQMELGLEIKRIGRRRERKGVPQSSWWFQQMRRTVDQAMTWKPAPAYSEQVYLASLHGGRR